VLSKKIAPKGWSSAAARLLLNNPSPKEVCALVPKKILFCTDFSENSGPAWDLARDYAGAFGSQLLVLHVIDYKSFPGYVDWVEKLREILDDIKGAANERLQIMVKECAGMVKDVKSFCRTGSTPGEIIALAQQESADLIVLGTHGRTGVKHLVMGSVARSVLKMAHRPVLIVEGPPEKGETLESFEALPVP
jgi:universal stress protein A